MNNKEIKKKIAENEDLRNLRFNITEEMNNMFIDIVVLRQMLKESKLTKRQRQLFEKELKELTTIYVLEFRKNNVEQRKKFNELMNK